MPEVRLNYVPSPGQLAFHQDRYVYAERLLSCGSGGGKSYAMLFELLDWCTENPPGVALFAMPTVPMFKKAIPDAWKSLTGASLGAKGTLGEAWHETDRRLRLPNGWDIWFVTVEDPTKIEGPPSVDLVMLDEARVVRRLAGSDGAWSQLTRRLRGSAQEQRRRGAVMGTHSPTKQIMELFEPVNVQRYRAAGPGGAVGYFEVADCVEPVRRAYQWGLQDAVAWRTLDQDGAATIMRGLTTDAEKKRVAEGRYALSAGLVFSMWDRARHMKEPPQPLKGARFAGGIDWGWDCTAIVVTADTGSRRWTVWEKRLAGATLDVVSRAMQEAESQFGRFRWWGGPDRPDDAALLVKMGHICRPAEPSRVMDGVSLMQTDLATGEWFVSPACKNLVEDLESQEIDEKTQEPDKRAYDAHFLDACRYERIMANRGTGWGMG